MPRPPPVVPFIQTGNPEMDRLQRFVQQALPGKQDNWVAPKLINGWVNFGAGFPGAGYMKDSTGFVRLRGTITNVAGTTASTPILVLPIGYRPSGTITFPIVDASTAAGSFRRINIDNGGTLVPTAVVGANTIISLDGVQYDTR